ncbi:hypothetical protein SAY87_003849 [Trapa incisa]|uniref:Uncharacterized protein n=1 Tax=Trapa incisa TaxID=236973 RepID=A0AAN7QJS6_9MYRT|nr:hypothetical protein SAY87_003849 [Trapa incisa]
MEMQSACRGLSVSDFKFLGHHRLISLQSVSMSSTISTSQMVLWKRSASTSCLRSRSKQMFDVSLLHRLRSGRRITSCAASFESERSLGISGGKGSSDVQIIRSSEVEPFRGKSGSVSFYGLTHQLVEEGKLESAPFLDAKGSYLWLLAPVALISSLILPQFFISNAVETFVKNDTLVEIVTSFFLEAIFYSGLATFLFITNHVQRPFLQYSTKRWSLITGLRGYLNSVFLTMGFKVVIPLFMVYITCPVVGIPAFVAVAPFLIGCIVQLIFEKILDRNQSSCWPVVPIIFEVYRLYQLTKAAHYIEQLMFAMKDLPSTPELLDKSGALVAMIVSFQVLGFLCLWSLVTFLLRLFPSRPVSENY